MTKYKLEDFKVWLEVEPSRKANLPYWEGVINFLKTSKFIPAGKGWHEQTIYTTVTFSEVNSNLSSNYQSYDQIIAQWVFEVDKKLIIAELESELQMKREEAIKAVEKTKELEEKNRNLERQVQELNKLSSLILFDQPYEFANLQSEIKRLKIQDLTIQIPLKKQELEQLTNTSKQKLTRIERYPLEKLLKKHSKALQINNTRSEKIEELKELLKEKLTQEELQTLLNKQTEIYQLEQHLESLQSEQVAQIQVNP